MPPNDPLRALKQCMRAAHGDPQKMHDCETDFIDAGGTVSDGGAATQEGGKVFGAPNGGKVFVDNGGKVFSPEA